MTTARLLKKTALLIMIWVPSAWLGARVLVSESELSQAEVIVVLGGSANYVERAQLAAQLYAAGRGKRIILTNDGFRGGWSASHGRNLFFVERAVDELHGLGIPKQSIEILNQPVSSTYDEAVLFRSYATDHQVSSVLVVTSAYHSRRALWTWRRVFSGTGITLGLRAAAPGQQTPSPATWWLSLRGWQLVPLEYLKLIYYWAAY